MISAPTPKMYTIPVGAAVLGSPTDRPTHPAGAAPCAPPGRLRTSAPTPSSPAPYPSLRCSSSPQRDRWRWVTLGTPNGHLPPWVGKACWAAFYRLPPLGGKLASEARLMRGLTVEGRGMFRPRARYFPWMESTQRSSGLRARTRGARLGRAPNLFGADMNLGPLRPPPAAARAGQIRRPLFPHCASRVPCLFGFGCFVPRTM